VAIKVANQERSSVKMMTMHEEEKRKKCRKLITRVLRYKNGTQMAEEEQIMAKTRRK
jgi:hypothetical protein